MLKFWTVPAARIVFGLAMALVLVSLVPTAAEAAKKGSGSSGFVYTSTNNVAGNEVLAYRRASDGTLTLFGRYSTGGTGTSDRPPVLGPPDTDQSLIINENRSLLFTVNERSDTIAVFQIGADGSLSHAKGSPLPSGGNMPVSLGISADKLYVVNKDDDPIEGNQPGPPNYTTFQIGLGGQLTELKKAAIPAPEGSSPTQALISPDGLHLFSSDFFAHQLRSLNIGGGGHLSEAPGSPIPVQDYPRPPASAFPPGNVVVGLQVHPFLPILYVGQAANGLVGGAEQVGVYTYDSTGRLTFVRAVEATGVATCWFIITRDGRFMYATNTADSSVSVFSLADPLNPDEIQKLTLSDGPVGGAIFTGTAPEQLAFSPDEKFIYVTSGDAFSGNPSHNALYILRVNPDGTVTEIGKTQTGLEPLGVATT